MFDKYITNYQMKMTERGVESEEKICNFYDWFTYDFYACWMWQ